MSKFRWLGLTSIQFGDTTGRLANYVPSNASMTAIENIVPGTARFVIEMPDRARIYVEDDSDPDIVVSNLQAAKFLEFSTRDMSTAVLIAAFGGTASGGVFPYLWPTAPDNLREKSAVITTEVVNNSYFKIEIGKCLISGGADLRMFRQDPDTGEVSFRFDIMKVVTDEGSILPPLKIHSV